VTFPLHGALEAMERRLDPEAGTPVAVAFSGGSDSMALLMTACVWGKRHSRPVLALHVDHHLQIRSDEWARRAQAVAGRLGADFRRLDWLGDKPATGLPAAARAARHRLIANAAREAGARVVLVGHTLDDQLENAVMRGSGATVGALAEWTPSPVWPEGRGLFHFRPLLAQRRAALRDWLAAEGLGWIDDPANADPRYARARARPLALEGQGQGLLPPAADIRALAAACRATAFGGFEIDRASLVAAPRDQALRLLQIAVACASGQEALGRPQRAASVLERLAKGEHFTASLAGARIEAGDAMRLCREAGEGVRGGLQALELAVGETGVWDGRLEVQAGTEGLRIAAVQGFAARLDPSDQALLKKIWPSARPSTALFTPLGPSTGPQRLALEGLDAHIKPKGMRFRMLGAARFAAAAGLLAREQDIGTIAHMAMGPPPSYVGGGL
jgi:tRNA(Ile)-lysidine synthase